MTQGVWIRGGARVIGGIAALALISIMAILAVTWRLPVTGDIAGALTEHPEAYTLSLGHMQDLTFGSFAYLRTPLLVAGLAFLIGATALWSPRPNFAIVIMMLLFLYASRLALVVFDPYLSSRPLAEALLKAPPGELIEDNAYYTFSSVFFYTNRGGLLLNGRKTNLEYGSYAPNASKVFLDDSEFLELWRRPARYFLLVEGPAVPRIENIVTPANVHVVAQSGGKYLLTNHANSD